MFNPLKRILPAVLVLLLLLSLSGCNTSIIPANDEDAVRSVINEYALALNDQNWNKAKGYCVNGSEPYYSVELKEDVINMLSAYCNLITLTYAIDINDVSIFGNTAIAYTHVISIVTACGYFEDYDYNMSAYLQKVGNNWKIYDSEYY